MVYTYLHSQHNLLKKIPECSVVELFEKPDLANSQSSTLQRKS